MKITIILAITCINRSEDSNNKCDSHTEEVCVLVSRLFQSEGDLRLEFVWCSVHVIEVTSGSIDNTAQETWQVPSTFFDKFVEKWINDVYETGVVSNIAVMQWSRSHYFCGSVQMSSRQSSSIFWRWFLLLCTMVNYWLNMIKPPFGGIFIRTFFQASKSRKPKSWFNEKWPICKTSSTFRSPTNEQTQHPKSCWLSPFSPPRTSTYNRDEGCSTTVPFLGCFPGDVLDGFFLRSPNLVVRMASWQRWG